MDRLSHPSSPLASSPESHVEAEDCLLIRRRKPLGIIQQGIAATNGSTSEIKRTAGPKESEYLLNYDSFVTSTIARYLARTQTNLRPNGKLPNYADMSPSQRKSALNSVDVLLERLTGTSFDNHVSHGAGSEQQHDDSVTTLGDEFSRLGNDETFGSTTTALGPNGEQYCDETHGSETTMGVDNRESTGAFSEEKLGVSTLLEDSMNLLSDDGFGGAGNDYRAAAADGEEDDDESRFSEGDDEFCEMMNNLSSPRNNDSSRSTTTSPIELARHTHDHANSRSLHLAFEDHRSTLDTSTTPPFLPQKHSSKRYASNSGKRGLKARHRSNRNGVDEELLGHFEGFSGDESDNGMYQYFHDDDSPIQRRFSNSGLESDCDYEMTLEHEVQELPDRRKGNDIDSKNRKGNLSEKRSSKFHTYDINIGGDYSAGEDQGTRRNSNNAASSMLRPQHSQWSSFRNAHANLTYTQLEEDMDNNDSPIRRGILYVGESQRQQSSSIHYSQLISHREEHIKGDTDESDPIQTVRNLCRRAKCLEKQGLDSLQEVAPIDVRVRDGMNFRIDPLRCHNDKYRNNRSSDPSLFELESFKDPISDFPSRVSVRLNAGVDFLIDKERLSLSTTANNVESEREYSCAILLSMTIQQILCVMSKFLIRTSQSTRNYQKKSRTAVNHLTPSFGLSSKDGDNLVGGTLIVLREKEDIEKWEVALREYTPLSVLTKQSNIRKLGPFAAKCAGFDVVLSTFDAIKSKEVTVSVNSFGHAILGSHEQSNSTDRWLASRASDAPAKCLQLSALHRLRWCRVIFLDVLGRKGYVTKLDTFRAKAANALNSKSRFILFEHAGDNLNKAETKKFFDDRKQLRSIFSTLHLPGEMKLDTLINTYIFDVKKSIRDSSSSDDFEAVKDNPTEQG